jgi:ribonucleoside-triphosphate reductase
VETQEEYENRARAAAFIGTLQAGYTDFHYLRDVWRRTTEKDALIGVSMTGIASGKVLNLDMKSASKSLRKRIAASQANWYQAAARTTCVKPAGTTSLTLGTSSGIHAWHNEHYIRRMRVGKNESIYTHLAIHHPELLKMNILGRMIQLLYQYLKKRPTGAITRSESALQLLKELKKLQKSGCARAIKEAKTLTMYQRQFL